MTPSPFINTQNPVNRRHPLARGLQAWWLTIPQWYGGNKWYDLCGLNNGTLTNMGSGSGWAPTVRQGGFGQLKFDGSNDSVAASVNLSAYSAITVSTWLNWTTFANNDNLAMEFTPNANSNDGFYFDPNYSGAGTGFAVLMHGGAGFNGGRFTRPSAGVWHHYAAVMDRAASASGLAVTVYVDGVAQTLTNTFTANISASNFANSSLFWMSRNSASLFGAGAQDGTMIHGRALSAAEVFALYNESRLGYPGLLNRWEWPLAGEAVAAGVPGISMAAILGGKGYGAPSIGRGLIRGF